MFCIAHLPIFRILYFLENLHIIVKHIPIFHTRTKYSNITIHTHINISNLLLSSL